jgi:hypothetical protein
LVLPECACPEQVNLPKDYEMTWVGDTISGIGLSMEKDGKCTVAPWADMAHKYMIPLIIEDKWLLLMHGLVLPEVKKSYPQILLEALKAFLKISRKCRR